MRATVLQVSLDGARRVLLLLLAPFIICSCATSTRVDADDSRPRLPPPVSDHSVDPGVDGETTVVPHVAVTLDADNPRLPTEGAQNVLERLARRCYRAALLTDRGLEGSVVYEMLVTSNGRVAGTEQMSTNAASQRLEECLERAMRGIRFDTSGRRDALLSRIYARFDLHRRVFDPSRPALDEPASTGQESQ